MTTFLRLNNLARISNQSLRLFSNKSTDMEGSIRSAGGTFAKKEAAQEDEYFYRQQKQQLAKLKETITDEIKFHEEQIKRHMEAIERNKKKVAEMGNE